MCEYFMLQLRKICQYSAAHSHIDSLSSGIGRFPLALVNILYKGNKDRPKPVTGGRDEAWPAVNHHWSWWNSPETAFNAWETHTNTENTQMWKELLTLVHLMCHFLQLMKCWPQLSSENILENSVWRSFKAAYSKWMEWLCIMWKKLNVVTNP